jgi:arsenite methyltransferase
MVQTKNSEPELSYFDLQAYVGTTKHMGGLKTTKELIELCHIAAGSYVLDVGCGVGATACLLAKKYDCRVVGIDLREVMITRSNERARAEGLERKVEFRVEDARSLPFEDGQFDAVICESVATFIEDKQSVVSECVRVTRPGGCMGFNEEVWLKTPPPADMVEFAKRTWEIESAIPTANDWVGYLESTGLVNITVRTYQLDARREASQIKRYGWKDTLKMVYRSLALYARSSRFRAYMAERRYVPKNLFEYLGYGIFVGRKQFTGQKSRT